MNLHLGLGPNTSDLKPVITDITSLQQHRNPHDHTQILLDAAQLAQDQENRDTQAAGGYVGQDEGRGMELEDLTPQELLENKHILQQVMTPATAIATTSVPKEPSTADVVKVFKQVHTKVMQRE